MRLPVVGLAIIGLMQAAGAGELDRIYLGPPSPLGPGTPHVAPAAPSPVRPHLPPAPPEGFTFEVGLRYGFSTGSLAKDLFDDPRASNALNSRLTYDALSSQTLEGYGRIDTTFGTFLKGYGGVSGLRRGTLTDEDFPPETVPYSNTQSALSGGQLNYFTIDIGQIAATTARTRVSVLAGYGHLSEIAKAFGCNQMAGSQICVPAISTTVLAITEDTSWDFARLGFLAEFRLLDRLTLSGEVAWLPYVQLNGTDSHWLRIGPSPGDFAGPIRQSGTGWGVQLESILSYQVTDCFNIGIGARYWQLQARGAADLEQEIIGASFPGPQPLKFSTTRTGGFLQGSYRFGPF